METGPSETKHIFDENCFNCCDLLEQLQYMKTHAYYKLVRNIHTILTLFINYPFTACSEIVAPLASPLQRFKEQDVYLASYPAVH